MILLVLMALSCAAINRDYISLLIFRFLCQVQVFSCEMVLISRLERLSSYFFPFLFSSYYHSIVDRVVRIVSDGCRQSSFVSFCVVFEPLYRFR